MSDLIDRQAAIEALKNCEPGEELFVIKSLPSAQPERKEGRWIVDPHTQDGYCSECKCDMPVFMEDWQYKSVATLYCPNCGAEMKGGDSK